MMIGCGDGDKGCVTAFIFQKVLVIGQLVLW